MRVKDLYGLERHLGIQLMTPDMEVCLYLYMFGPVPSLALHSNVRVSSSSYYNVQRRLKDRGIIYALEDPDDMRVTLYDLAAHAREAIALHFGDREQNIRDIPQLETPYVRQPPSRDLRDFRISWKWK